MDNYAAVFNAVRSQISSCDPSVAIRDAVSLDGSHAIAVLQEQIYCVSHEWQRPSVLFRPRLVVDGDKWCAFYGDNIQDGVAGFGDSPDEAMRNFDMIWTER